MIIQLRAPMGGGKTYCMRHVLEAYKMQPVDEGLNGSKKRPEAYRVPGKDPKLAVLGPYVATCGGMDAVNSVQQSIDIINKYAAIYNVVTYEGMMLGHIYGRHGEAMISKYGDDHLFVFLNTPLDVCIERVRKRREARGADGKNFDPKNIKQSYDTVWSSHDRVLCNGGRVLKIGYKDAPKDFLKLVRRYANAR